MSNVLPGNKGNTQRALKKLRRAMRYRGVIATVARELGRSRVHVHQVAAGRRRSPRVEAALAAEILRRDAVQDEAAA